MMAHRATDSIVWWSWDATPILYSRCQASSRKPEVVASGRWPVLEELQREALVLNRKRSGNRIRPSREVEPEPCRFIGQIAVLALRPGC